MRMLHRIIPPRNDPHPWLVYHTGDKQFFCPPILSDSDSKLFPPASSIPALRGISRILSTSSFGGSHYHLICIHPSHLIIWNQKTHYALLLPPLPEDLSHFHLIHSFGDLISIFISFQGRGREAEILGAEMHKLNWNSKSWERLLSNDKYFFLNAQNSFSCLANSEEGVGRIFVFKFKDLALHSIDVRDTSVSSFIPHPILPKPWESPYWVPADLGSSEEEEEDGDSDDEGEE